MAAWYQAADLADAFAVMLEGLGPNDVASLAERALRNPAPWVSTALAVRDLAVRPFGVLTSGEMRSRLERGGRDRVGFFPVLSRSAREIVLGEDDRHLDFRLSLLLDTRDDGQEILTATSVVRCHTLFGRAYLAAIHPGHVLVVRSALARAGRR
ncbi:DUF2867 domain-containing protein [Methylobacterium sp. ID0610]|uniref:DUF2867 domain-containing protein n=1 Tax=Methylobacterium carpenticola TaxID=3344827 RepID=UPI0036D3A292